MQTTSNILMVRPVAFGFNAETAVNNAFQRAGAGTDVNGLAQQEFDQFVTMLRSNGINVLVIDDSIEPHTPDSIFPNNWASYHEDGSLVLYPMFATNRRGERRKNIREKIENQFFINTTFDLTEYEGREMYLEGTGSLVLDRVNKIAYACISPRTHPTVLYDFCQQMGYTPVLFSATDKNGQDIYHTNVIMCVADDYVVVCMESVKDAQQQKILTDKFDETGKKIISISFEQMSRFAGNMLQVYNQEGRKLLIMSTQAYQSLTPEQIETLEPFNPILHASLYTIEQNGGGSARCMMAEIFLPEKKS